MTETVIVAPRHVVDVVIGRRTIGFDQTLGKEVFGPIWKSLGPGESVELSADEITRLRSLGFLVDPAKPPPPDSQVHHAESR